MPRAQLEKVNAMPREEVQALLDAAGEEWAERSQGRWTSPWPPSSVSVTPCWPSCSTSHQAGVALACLADLARIMHEKPDSYSRTSSRIWTSARTTVETFPPAPFPGPEGSLSP
jgi:hypothetical protein